jgi:YVTN family beta-propeller protein
LTHPAGIRAARVTGLTGRPFGVGISSAGVVYVTQQDANAVARFSLSDLVPRASIPVGSDPGDVVFTRAGATAFVSGFEDGSLHAIDVASGEPAELPPVSSNAYRLGLSSDEKRVFVTSTDGRLYALDMRGEPVAAPLQLRGALQGLALSPSGRTLFVSSNRGSVWKVDAATLRVMGPAATGGGRLQDVAVAPDESEIYAASENGWVDVLDAATMRRRQRIVLPGLAPFGLTMTPDGAQLYVTSPNTGDVVVIDRATREVIRTIRVSGTPRRVAFDRTGGTAAISNESNWVDIVR